MNTRQLPLMAKNTKQNFSKEYYKENPPCEIGQDKSCISLGKDGGIDVELTPMKQGISFMGQALYFKPQLYFYPVK